MEKLVSIRGATQAKENTVNEIKKAVIELLEEIIIKNKINVENIVNIMFTVTDDLDAIHPATVARESLNLNSTPMLCSQEVKIQGDLQRCIRVMVQAYSNLPKEKVKHVYLREAAKLRPDLNAL